MSPRPLKRKPPEKPVDNKKAIKNILSLLKDHKIRLILTVVCAVISTVFTIIAPLLIGRATTIIFDGINNIIHHTGSIDFDTLFHHQLSFLLSAELPSGEGIHQNQL